MRQIPYIEAILQLIQDIKLFVGDDIKQVDSLILDHVRAANESLVEEVASYLLNSGGKRIRPLLTLLSAKLCGCKKGNAQILLAAAVEFIHAATLLHDDVIDGSDLRRAKPTANHVWGNKTSILVGDYLFSQSFQLMVQTRSLEALEVLSTASALIVEGELSQLVALNNAEIISQEDYIKIITAKTATLFAAASRVGAIVSDRADLDDATEQYGMLLGIIFQISDDVLDYNSDVEKTGKNIGDDFFEGKITLPIIILLQKLQASESLLYADIVQLLAKQEKTSEDLQNVVKLMHAHDVFTHIEQVLNQYHIDARTILNDMKNVDDEARSLMHSLLEFAVSRDN